MDTPVIRPSSAAPALEIDLIVDLACPWSYIARRQLKRALGSLHGTPVRAVRWHGLPSEDRSDAPVTWREYLQSRLPKGADLVATERELEAVGRDVGIRFAFDRIAAVPDTSEAHRLVGLAASDASQALLIDALFAAHFEQGRDLADHAVLAALARESGIDPGVVETFEDSAAGRDAVRSESRRLRGLGVASVPNVLLNGTVLVPGPADVDTYVTALDRALFPGVGNAAPDRRLLH